MNRRGQLRRSVAQPELLLAPLVPDAATVVLLMDRWERPRSRPRPATTARHDDCPAVAHPAARRPALAGPDHRKSRVTIPEESSLDAVLARARACAQELAAAYRPPWEPIWKRPRTPKSKAQKNAAATREDFSPQFARAADSL